ncbi:MAG: hypothetical protein JW819_04345 [Candidatus Krumholzibacteriota bacterium]|nr:hypothetical protein [Candidatus Krumholzibacteriota bacterium]
MSQELPDFKARLAAQRDALGEDGLARLLDAGRARDLAPVLGEGGALIFPHASLPVCGHLTAAVVHACLDCGAGTVLALGVLHGLTAELREARERVAAGGDPGGEPLRGVQGPGLHGRRDWEREFSLDGFRYLWEAAAAQRGSAPRLVLRYPFLAGGRPADLPGMAELADLARGAAVVATADPFHHGVGYGDAPGASLAPEAGGLALARQRIVESLALLRAGDHAAFERQCVAVKSDARDTGQVLRHLRGPLAGELLDLVADDMSGPYGAPAPTWVAGALIALRPAAGS